MALNYIWVGFFLIAFVVALVKLVFFQDYSVFPEMLQATFDKSRTGFELSLYLTGVMSLWLGFMKIGEKGGMVPLLSKVVGPFFSRLFPDVPENHPARGSIIMNFSANMLGLDNAATPLGLKAMSDLQELNPDKETASNAQITFLVLNTSGLTIIPLSVIADRAAMGFVNPASIFIPTLIATFFSSMVGLLYISFRQKINLLDPILMAYLVGLSTIIFLTIWYFTSISTAELQSQSILFSSVIIITIIISFLTLGLYRRIPLFETFIEGAKEGFTTSIKIIPYLIAILVAIGVFIASGTLSYITDAIGWLFSLLTLNTDFVESLPVAFLKPLSAQSARAMMITISEPIAKSTGGIDTFSTQLSATIRGCTETTFYVLAVYFGSVNIKKTRYALTAGLIADFAGIVAAIFVAYLFFK